MIGKLLMIIGAILMLLACPLGLNAAQIDRGIEQIEAGDFASAKQSFEIILEADADDHVAHYYMGRIALEKEDLDGAIDRLRYAVKLDESDSNYRTWLGRAYIAKLQTATFQEKGVLAGRALDNLKKAVELDPSNIEAGPDCQ